MRCHNPHAIIQDYGMADYGVGLRPKSMCLFNSPKYVIQSHLLTLSYFESEQIFMKTQRLAMKQFSDRNYVKTLRVLNNGESKLNSI